MIDIKEQWRAVVGYEDYYDVSSFGRIRRTKVCKGARCMILRPQNCAGRLQIGLSARGVAKRRFIHRLVAFAFLGPPPAGKLLVNHKDGNPANNHLENLEWVSDAENYAHYQYILGGKGLTLNLAKAEEIRRLYATGQFRQVDLGKKFNVPQSTISKVVLGKGWKRAKTHIPKVSTPRPPIISTAPEVWRKCVGYAKYEVSNKGRVRRCSTPAQGAKIGRIFTPGLDKAGYPQVSLRPEGKQKLVRVHRLVCRVFNGRPPANKTHVNHKDGRRTNNIRENLEWCNDTGNTQHRFGYSLTQAYSAVA